VKIKLKTNLVYFLVVALPPHQL